MSEILLFKNRNGSAELIKSEPVGLEKQLQTFIENNLETIFGIQLLASEYAIPGGRMDSLGLDENNSPVIIEYKRNANDNVINQGLFYLNWLVDHKGDFQILVQGKLGMEVTVEWTNPSVICIASDFNKYDEHAVNQMQKNILLYRYKKYGDELLLLEGVNTPLQPIKVSHHSTVDAKSEWIREDTDVYNRYMKAPPQRQAVFDEVKAFALSLSDEIKEVYLKHYVAFRVTRNFMTVQISQSKVLIYLSLDVEEYQDILAEEQIRNVREIGHYGTGDLEVELYSLEDFERYKYLIQEAYERNVT